MISREVSVCNLRRNSESYSGLQPGLNGNPFFCGGLCFGKKDWEWRTDEAAPIKIPFVLELLFQSFKPHFIKSKA